MSTLSNSALLKSSEQQLVFSKELLNSRSSYGEKLEQITSGQTAGSGHGPILIDAKQGPQYDLSSKISLLGHNHPIKICAQLQKPENPLIDQKNMEEQLNQICNEGSPYEYSISDQRVTVFNPNHPEYKIFDFHIKNDLLLLEYLLRYFLVSDTFKATGRVKKLETLIMESGIQGECHDNFLEISTNEFSHAKIKIDEGNKVDGKVYFRFPLTINESHIKEIAGFITNGLKG